MDKFVNTLGEIKKSTQELGEKFSNSFGKHFDPDKRLVEGVAVSETGKMRLPEQIIAKALGYSEPTISLASNLSELKNGEYYSKDIQRDTSLPPKQLELLKSQGLQEGMVGEVRALKDIRIENNEFLNKETAQTTNGEIKMVSNLERMKQGNAPIGEDGKPYSLHHNNQEMTSSLSELTDSFHKENFGNLHRNPGKYPSRIDRIEFAKQRSNYWKHRAAEIESRGIV